MSSEGTSNRIIPVDVTVGPRVTAISFLALVRFGVIHLLSTRLKHLSSDGSELQLSRRS